MQIVEKLYDMIEEEMDDAEKYIRCAQNHKEDMPTLAETFYTLSLEEMKHMKMLHDQVVMIIENYKKTQGPPPERMQVLYDYVHKKSMERASEIRAMQTVYKSKE